LRILVVCTANVCRSPMGEALLRHHCAVRQVDAVISSAGTNVPGLPVDPQAVKLLIEMGLDIATHRPRQLTRALIDTDGRDLVLTMTREQLRHAATSADGAFRRTFTLLELARHLTLQPPLPGERLAQWLDEISRSRRPRDLLGDNAADDVDDPYGRSVERHRLCAAEIGLAVESVAAALATLTAGTK